MKKQNTLLITMKKNPFLYKHFVKIKNNKINKGFSDFFISSLFYKIKKYSNLLKQNNFNIIEIDSFEKISDDIDKIVKKNKIKKYISSFLSNKYKHLINEESEVLFSSIFDMKFSHSELANYFCKIASFKNPEDLNNMLSSIILSSNQFSINYFIEKINKEKLNAEIIEIDRDKNTLLLRINDFKASKELGSSHWCICRYPSFFYQYTHKKGKYLLDSSQYFYYSFSLSPSDRFRMIGVTVSKDKFIIAADFFDKYIGQNFPLCEKIMDIHNNYIDENFIVNHFIKRFSDSRFTYNFDQLELFYNYLKPIDLSKINDETIINISLFFDNFSSKSLRKKSSSIFEKIILKRFSLTDNISDDIKILLEEKYTKILLKMSYLGYNINSKKINNILKNKC